MSRRRQGTRVVVAAQPAPSPVGLPGMSRFSEGDTVARVLATRPELFQKLGTLYPRIGCFHSRDLAARVSLEEAARMAHVTSESLVSFVNAERSDLVPQVPSKSPVPDWVEALEGENTKGMPHYDARTDIAAGSDPRAAIEALAETIPDGGLFAVDAPFDPVPLRHVLGREGFASHASLVEDGHWRVLFLRGGPVEDVLDTDADGSGTTLDLRGLEPPEPMVAILRMIEGNSTVTEISVRLERDPVFLYPELEERGWSWEVLNAIEGDVRLRLFRDEGEGAQ